MNLAQVGRSRPDTHRVSAVRGGRKGVTLIELAIVLAIIMILSAIGIAMGTGLGPRWNTRAAAQEFAAHVSMCRMTAVRTGRECRIWMIDYDTDMSNLDSNTGEYWIAVGNKNRGSTTWDYLPVDDYDATGAADDDLSEGIIDLGDASTEFYKRHVAIDNWGTIGGPGVSNTDAIHFDARGNIINPSSDFSTDGGYIRITFVNKLAAADGRTEAWYVDLYPTGSSSITNNESVDMSGGS